MPAPTDMNTTEHCSEDKLTARFSLHRLVALVLPVICVLQGNLLFGEEQDLKDDQLQFFEKKIRPALVKYCYECHSVESGTTRGGLLVDTRLGLLEGGDSGAALVPHKIDDSLLWDAINWTGYEMPPSRKMPADVIDDFRKWIEMGAPDPRERKQATFTTKITPDVIREGKEHWAFQPPRLPQHSDIDACIDAKLREESLTPNGQAEPLTLLRRLRFDLTGLPPTPAEVQAFLSSWNRDPQRAVESKVNQLLSQRQYGEQWGRLWLDVARYADTSGNVNVTYPEAWRYRDYVIDAFNKDKPYNEFIQEQLAGDLLPANSKEERQEHLLATGYLAVGMKRLNERNPRKFRMDMVDEQIDTVTQSILGVTVACARCHDHKYDPIPSTDYYALAGIFQSTETLYGTVWGQQNHRPSDLMLLPILDDNDGEDRQSIPELRAQIVELRAEMRRMNAAARESGERVQIDFVRMRNRISAIEGEIAMLNPDGTKKTFGMAVRDAANIADANVLVSGDVERPAQSVPRGFLQVLDDVKSRPIPSTSSGRLEMALWMTSRDNPLTARVFVNRVWMKLFGTPIVGTPNNWGVNGIPPTNQDLLDLLAIRFMENGWSVKSLIREIILSDAYQRSSGYDAANSESDPDNKFFWRMSPRQLEAEALRDAMLAAGGNLDTTRPKSVMGDFGNGRVDRGPGAETRFQTLTEYRSIYLPVIRDGVHESMELFDFPDPNGTSARRQESVVPPQALYMMNGEFAIQQATKMAEKMASSSGELSGEIRWAFLTAYGRPPTSTEMQSSIQFLKSISPMIAKDSVGMTAPGDGPGAGGPGMQRRRPGRPDRANGPGRPGFERPGPRNRVRPGIGPNRPGQQQQSRESIEKAARMLFCQSLLASAEFRVLD